MHEFSFLVNVKGVRLQVEIKSLNNNEGTEGGNIKILKFLKIIYSSVSSVFKS